MKYIIGYFSAISLLFLGAMHPAHVYAVGVGPTFCLDGKGIETAIGCISSDPAGLTQKLLGLSLSIAGGIAFLMIILGGIQVQISAGNPKRLEAGREIIEGAIIGLLLILFSIFILKMIGVDFLGIPGMS
jgi:hypothetical protein